MSAQQSGRKWSRKVTVSGLATAALLVAAGASGCGSSSDEDYQCVNEQGVVASDGLCDGGHAGFFIFMNRSGHRYPSGYTVPPTQLSGRVPADNPTARSKAGFGARGFSRTGGFGGKSGGSTGGARGGGRGAGG